MKTQNPKGTNSALFQLSPMFRYAGGKSKLAQQYFASHPIQAQTYTHIHDLFMGAGGLLTHAFNQRFASQFIGYEWNQEIYQVYQVLQSNPEPFIRRIIKLFELWNTKSESQRKELYYYIRSHYQQISFNSDRQAALLFFLLKTSYNGLIKIGEIERLIIEEEEVGKIDGTKPKLTPKTITRFSTAAGYLNRKINIESEIKNIKNWITAIHSKQILIRNENAFDEMKLGRVSKFSDPQSRKTLFFIDPPYLNSVADYGTNYTEDDHALLFDFAEKQALKQNTVMLMHTKNEFYLSQIQKLKQNSKLKVEVFEYDYKHTINNSKPKSVIEMLIVVNA